MILGKGRLGRGFRWTRIRGTLFFLDLNVWLALSSGLLRLARGCASLRDAEVPGGFAGVSWWCPALSQRTPEDGH